MILLTKIEKNARNKERERDSGVKEERRHIPADMEHVKEISPHPQGLWDGTASGKKENSSAT